MKYAYDCAIISLVRFKKEEDWYYDTNVISIVRYVENTRIMFIILTKIVHSH